MDYPVKKKAKERRIEKRTILRFCDNEEIAIRKRPGKGLLAGLYEFPNVEGHLTQKEVIEYAKESGLTPVRVKKLPKAKHIFSHVEWHMTGYEILVDELEKEFQNPEIIFAGKKDLEKIMQFRVHFLHIYNEENENTVKYYAGLKMKNRAHSVLLQKKGEILL